MLTGRIYYKQGMFGVYLMVQVQDPICGCEQKKYYRRGTLEDVAELFGTNESNETISVTPTYQGPVES